MLFWSLRNGSPANHWVLGSSAAAWISAASPGRQKSFRMKEKRRKMDAKDFIRFLWLSYVVMLLCHEWYVVNNMSIIYGYEWYVVNNMSILIYVHIHIVNLCQYMRPGCQNMSMVQKCRKLGHRWTIFWPICLQHSTSCANDKTDKKQGTDASSTKKIEKKKHVFFGQKPAVYSGSKRYCGSCGSCGSTQLHAASPASDWTNRLPMSARGW